MATWRFRDRKQKVDWGVGLAPVVVQVLLEGMFKMTWLRKNVL